MNIMNCTPHAITIKPGSLEGITIAPSGIIPRVTMSVSQENEYFAIKVTSRVADEVIGLPIGSDGKVLPCIVSGMVVDALRGRAELVGVVFAPDTGDSAIRNDKGHVVAVTCLVTVRA